jgi:hypothetical protein
MSFTGAGEIVLVKKQAYEKFLRKNLYICPSYCRFVYDSENPNYPSKTTIRIRTHN